MYFSYNPIRRALIAAGFALMGGAAQAQSPSDAATAVPGVVGVQTPAPILVEGFRSARFGMDEAAVRQAIETDFAISGDAIVTGSNPAERTQILSVEGLDVLDGGGAADVSYVLGYRSSELSQVSVLWSVEADGAIDGDQLVANANVLQAYFMNAGYRPETVIANVAVPEGLLMFRGADAQGRMTVLILRGTLAAENAGEEASEGEGEDAAQPVLTPTSLLLAYLADPENPDVFQVEPGQF